MTSNHNILVTGAAGFIGKPTVRQLLDRGWNVKAMVRKVGPIPFSPHARLRVVYADIRESNSLIAALKDVEVVVHLAAAKSDEKWSEDVNVAGAMRLVDACKANGCARIINISSVAAKVARKGIYGTTKHKADEVFDKSGLRVTTLFPHVVYGEEKSGIFWTVLGFVERLPVVPVLGDGKWVCAPIYVGDVAEAICRCIERDTTTGRNYDLAGPNVITFDDFLNKVSGRLGRRRRIVRIPFGVSLLAARSLAALLTKPPITVSNVLTSNQNVDIDIGPARRDFGFNPLDFDIGLKKVLTEDGHPETFRASTLGTASPRGNGELAAECMVFARYLIGQGPPQELVERYIVANRILLGEEESGPEEHELRFVRLNPSALPFIDAAAGLLKPESLLRKKLLVMTAILEATPIYTGSFLRKPGRPLALIGKLLWQGVLSAAKITLGIPVFWVAQKG
jgi:nucleoside-diphosphate-sugar epimerase